MKIILFDQFGAGSAYSGPGNYFANLFRANNQKQFSVKLVHGNKNQKQLPCFDQIVMPSLAGGVFNNAIFGYKSAQYLKNNKDYDVFQSTHCYMTSIVAAKQSIKNDKPTFLRIAKSNSELENRNNLSKLLNLSKKKVDVINTCQGIVAISTQIKNELLRKGVSENKIHFIPNGVDIKKFCPEAISDNIQCDFFNESNVIGFCGEIVERKQPHLILQALAELDLHYKLCLIGPYNKNSPYIKYLHRLIDDLKLKERVLFVGYTTQPEMYLRKCNFFCLPSKCEGMPNALLEAMASGCIPISTNVSGVADIIASNEYGFVINSSVSDIVSCVNAGASKLNFFKENARKRIVENFSSQKAFDSYMQMYRGFI